jgi:hypothetical protein
VGIAVGGVIFGGHLTSPATTAKTEKAVSVDDIPSTTAKSVLPVTDAALARIYVRMNTGEKLAVNGKDENVTPGANGYGFLQLPAGKYEITLRDNNQQSRNMTLAVEKAGTWLINPQG